MKKKLLIAAVGAAMGIAPMIAAHAATTLYGRLNLGIAAVDNGNDSDADTLAVRDDASRIGVKGDEDLGGGLKAIYTVELALDADGNKGVSLDVASSGGGSADTGSRDVFAGLQGSWGTVRLGHFNSAYKNLSTPLELFGDTVGDFTHTTFQGESRLANTIAYSSPKFSGMSFAVENARGETGTPTETNPTILAASWTAGPLYVGLGRLDADNQGTTGLDDALKFVASYAFGDFKFWGVFEDAGFKQANGDRQTTHAGASYKMGNNTFGLTWTNYEQDGADNDSDQIALGVIHALSKNTALKFVWSDIDNETGANSSGRMLQGVGLTSTGTGKDPSAFEVQLSLSF